MGRLSDLGESSRAWLLKLECPIYEKHPKSLGMSKKINFYKWLHYGDHPVARLDRSLTRVVDRCYRATA
jgi:hypothetical protein